MAKSMRSEEARPGDSRKIRWAKNRAASRKVTSFMVTKA